MVILHLNPPPSLSPSLTQSVKGDGGGGPSLHALVHRLWTFLLVIQTHSSSAVKLLFCPFSTFVPLRNPNPFSSRTISPSTRVPYPHLLKNHIPFSSGTLTPSPQEPYPFSSRTAYPHLLRNHIPISWGTLTPSHQEPYPLLLKNHIPFSWGTLTPSLKNHIPFSSGTISPSPQESYPIYPLLKKPNLFPSASPYPSPQELYTFLPRNPFSFHLRNKNPFPWSFISFLLRNPFLSPGALSPFSSGIHSFPLKLYLLSPQESIPFLWRVISFIPRNPFLSPQKPYCLYLKNPSPNSLETLSPFFSGSISSSPWKSVPFSSKSFFSSPALILSLLS